MLRGLSHAPSTRWMTLCDSHSFSFCPFKPSQSFSSPLNLLLPLSHPVIECLRQIGHPTTTLQIFFSLFSPLSVSPSSLLPASFLSVHCWGDSGADRQGEKISAGVPQDWRGGWQRDSRGEEDTWTDMRVKLITGDCQLEGKVMGLFASQRHPKNITSSHHVYPLQPQDHSSVSSTSAISGGSLDAEGDTVGEHASSVCRHGWYVLSG